MRLIIFLSYSYQLPLIYTPETTMNLKLCEIETFGWGPFGGPNRPPRSDLGTGQRAVTAHTVHHIKAGPVGRRTLIYPSG